MDIQTSLINLLKKQTKLKQIKLEIPPSPDLGDFAFPCFELAKKQKKNPVEIASDLASKIKPSLTIKQIKSTGPYLNFFINQNILVKQTLKHILKQKNKYGKSNEKSKIMIEFSQANTHKAFHIGHVRGTSLGESLARILEFRGNKVIRANYQGDTGMHVAKWIWCYQKYHSKEPLKNDESWIASIYVDAVRRLDKNPKLQEEVNEINKKLEESKDKKLIKVWKKTRKASLNAFEKIYKEFNTKFNIYYFERQFEKKGKKITQKLHKKSLAKLDNGATIIELEKQKQNDGPINVKQVTGT